MDKWPLGQISMLTDSLLSKKQDPQAEVKEEENTSSKIKKKRTNIKGICSDVTDRESLPSDYVVMDFETTGLMEYDSKIIQVAAYKYRGHMKIDEMVTYVDPGEPIPQNITELTGIHDDDVQGAPTIDKALPKLIEFIKNEIIIGHNISFDLRFLVYNAEQCGVKLPRIEYIDTLKLARRYIDGAENYKLETLKERLGIIASSHSADEDCYVCGEVYRMCAMRAGVK